MTNINMLIVFANTAFKSFMVGCEHVVCVLSYARPCRLILAARGEEFALGAIGRRSHTPDGSLSNGKACGAKSPEVKTRVWSLFELNVCAALLALSAGWRLWLAARSLLMIKQRRTRQGAESLLANFSNVLPSRGKNGAVAIVADIWSRQIGRQCSFAFGSSRFELTC